MGKEGMRRRAEKMLSMSLEAADNSNATIRALKESFVTACSTESLHKISFSSSRKWGVVDRAFSFLFVVDKRKKQNYILLSSQQLYSATLREGKTPFVEISYRV